jgi:uncharacterized glyoxalase superfamily protein PhnB
MTTVFPTLKYDDAHAAIEFLTTALGFEKHAVHETGDGKVGHAELRHGDGMVMLGSRGTEGERYDSGRAVIYVVVDDPDGLHDRARAAGAEIVAELSDQDYGSRDFAAADPEGNIWSFGTYDPMAPVKG